MKFPSIKNLADSFWSTIKNYPFELLFALAGTIAGTIEVELRHLNRVHEGWLMRGVMTANLGLLLSLSATLFTRSRDTNQRNKLLLKIAAAVLSVLLFFVIDPSVRVADYIRFFLFCLAFHLLVSFAAFTGKGRINGFWQFNKTLFLRFLTGALYGVVLFLGIAAAIGATNFLFSFNFEWDTYAILWIWIVGTFTTTFFLAGVPVVTAQPDEDLGYPKALKIFTQYVLIPLSTVYVIILLAYEIKILVQWSLPKGLVSNLVLGYAVFGILSLLLVYPVREQAENKWIKVFARSFYFLLIPLLGLLFVAVGVRVFKYGITEWRYFLIALACWLLFISVYFLAFKKQNIKLIPISLCILTLLSVYGPQSAFSVSMYSQKRIIIKFFEKYNGYKNGKFIPVDSTKVKMKDGVRVVATLEYFIDKYDLTALQPYFNANLTAVSDSLGKLKSSYPQFENEQIGRYELRGRKSDWVKSHLKLNAFDGHSAEMITAEEKLSENYNFNATHMLRELKGFDFLLTPPMVIDTGTFDDNYAGIKITHTLHENRFCTLKINTEVFRFDAAEVIKKLFQSPKTLDAYKKPLEKYEYQATYEIPPDSLSLVKQTNHYQVKLQLENASFSMVKGEEPHLTDIRFGYLIKLK
ncbi:MAG TPA: DUF4153 domain-containing protein [Mucilaginibacter sp.]